MNATIERTRAMSDQMQERASRVIIPAVRIIVGLLWLIGAGVRVGFGAFRTTTNARLPQTDRFWIFSAHRYRHDTAVGCDCCTTSA